MNKYVVQRDAAKKKLAKRIFLGDLEECKIFPKYFMIESINACNARCIMCGIYNSNRNSFHPVHMKMELFEKIVASIKPYNKWVEMISVYGRGEPLLDKNLSKKIELLNSIGIEHIQISTNASLLTRKRAEELFSSGLNDLRISIDSVRKDRYERIRMGLKYESVMSNILDTINVRNKNFPNVSIRIRAVDMDINSDEKEEWLKFWGNHIIEGYDMAQFITYRDSWAETGKKKMCRSSPCISPFSTMVICSNGDVKLCCEAIDSDMILGNLEHDNIQDIWNSAKLQSIRELHLEYKWDAIPSCRGYMLWEDGI